jgi:hypothetical protein
LRGIYGSRFVFWNICEAIKTYVDDEIKHYTDLMKKVREFILNQRFHSNTICGLIGSIFYVPEAAEPCNSLKLFR